ncbi:MAG: DEAD/DEAH box helicase [Planctomycetota bacterium]|nr:DEAD/DEAH box helicase [Planctomycetota bacterium]
MQGGLIFVIHANWAAGYLHLWAESLDQFNLLPLQGKSSIKEAESNGVAVGIVADQAERHSYTVSSDVLMQSMIDSGIELASVEESNITLKLPHDLLGPWPSDRLVSIMGDYDRASDPLLGEFSVPTLKLEPNIAVRVLSLLSNHSRDEVFEIGQSVRFWNSAGQMALDLLVDQRFIPTLFQVDRKHLTAKWTPWLHDEEVVDRFGLLLRGMPPIARSTTSNGRLLLETAIEDIANGVIRKILMEDNFKDAIQDWDASADAHVSWLEGLLGHENAVIGHPDRLLNIFTDARRWLGRLCDIGEDLSWRLLLELHEPEEEEAAWLLSFALQSAEDASREISAEEVWGEVGSESGSDDRLPELFLAELDRAAALYSKLESSLQESTPCSLELTTTEAHRFLVEIVPLLEESGFRITIPIWWGSQQSLLNANLHIDSPMLDAVILGRPEGSGGASSTLGLNAIVDCQWRVAVGGQMLTQEEFEQLLKQKQPLVKVQGQWVHLHEKAIEEAKHLFANGTSIQMPLVEALRLTRSGGDSLQSLTIGGLTATGWVHELLAATTNSESLPEISQPTLFEGQLRPYQLTGLRWMAFLSRFGIGTCLADDMGLGKTIQLSALLQHERAENSDGVGPTLLIVPTSVVGNWCREIDKFSPELKVHVHHGPDRPLGEAFSKAIANCDVVITTYGLVHRDRDTLGEFTWFRAALDEAQYIKNPPTKQAQSIRSLKAWHRVALTGTPVENRLVELWSIMEFLNPGYLGPAATFRRTIARPIEQRRDPRTSEELRRMIQPFVLRRLKTDATVIDDLPECVQTKEYANLTKEQAGIYEQVVEKMVHQVERSEGIQRRGLVLSTLVKLKQVCNHPAHYSQAGHRDGVDVIESSAMGLQTARSGKAARLMTLLEEVIATGEKALVFTQFREMGRLLSAMIQHDLDCETLFLHGGTPPKRRQQFIDRFQASERSVPVFILSLKAGGVGLNLTAANHVFHYDRWWNPAIENQANDRAFRIGQLKTVQVHKFVCTGTLEEKIDYMIEQKMELAQNIVGSGEQWISELTASQLRDMLVLRDTALEEDG